MDDVSPSASHVIATRDALLGLFGAPSKLATIKVITSLDQHCRRFIALSPFIVIGSSDPTSKADTSPKGDPPGFVQVLDDHTIVIPDRPGNNRIDTLLNIVENPEIAVIFFVPGVDETLRVNGRARLSVDPELLARMAVQGKAPKIAIVLQVREAYLHCAKALKRSKLWDVTAQVPRTALASLGRMIIEQAKAPDSIPEIEERIEQAYREKLY